jgi:muconolactone delta-isomerase
LTPPAFPNDISCDEADNFSAENATYSNSLYSDCNIYGTVIPTIENNWSACGGTITVSYIGLDECGRILEAGPFTINVLVAPVANLTAPSFPNSITCDEADNFSAENSNLSNSLNGNCDISGSVAPTIINNWSACGGTITVSYNGLDKCGRTLEAGLFTINVLAAPIATLAPPAFPNDISCDEADNFSAENDTYSNSLDDDCNISGSVAPTIENNWDACGGTITVSYNGQDECGRTLEAVYLPPILVPVVKLKKQYIYKFSKRLNYEKQEEKIHKIVQT